MGRDKAVVDVAGRTMLELVLETAGIVGEPLLVGWSGGDGGVAAIPDLRPGPMGPLAGLEAALVWARGRDVVLLAVDQPFVRAETLESLLGEPGEAVVPLAGGWLQATCAVYRDACLDRVKALLGAEERSLQRLLAAVAKNVVDEPTWRGWGEDGRSWFSIDTLERLEEGLVRYR